MFKGFAIRNRDHVPQYLKLPYGPKGKILKLYQTLSCTIVLDKCIFLVIVSIPLLDNISTFDIF